MEKEKEFTIEIQEGYLNNTCQATLNFSHEFERKWYSAISSEAFHNINFYRASDLNYGLRSLPRIELKRNLKCMLSGTGLKPNETVTYLNSLGLSSIQCRTGNTRYITALDQDNNELYDLVYKEIFVLSHKVSYSADPTEIPTIYSNECKSLKTSLVSLLGSDDSSITEEFRYAENSLGKDDASLYRVNPRTSTISNYSDFVSAGFDINSFLPILPIAYVKPGQGKTLVQNIIDDGYVQDTFYDVILVANQIMFEPRGDYKVQKSVLNLKN